MKKRFVTLFGLFFIFSILIMGCNNSSDNNYNEENDSSNLYQQESQLDEERENIPTSDVKELLVQFGDEGETFVMHLEDNSTASAITYLMVQEMMKMPLKNVQM